MKSDSVVESSPNFEFVDAAMKAVGEARYRDALAYLDEGIHELAARDEINSGELLKRLKILLAYLDFRLGEDFGTKWETHAQEEEPEIRCSFCGERKSEERKIIAGPGVFICNECINRCAAALEMN